MAKKALLLFAAGSRSRNALKAFAKFEEIAAELAPGLPAKLAFAAKDGSVEEAVESFAREGAKQIAIVPLLLLDGAANRALLAAAEKLRSASFSLEVSRPLLCEREARRKLCETAVAEAARKAHDGEALLFVGHGSEEPQAAACYEAAAQELAALDKRALLATLKGEPGLTKPLAELKRRRAEKALLIPFMIAAGVHVERDVAGAAPSSVKSVLEAEGIRCEALPRGLGELDEVARLALRGLPQGFLEG